MGNISQFLFDTRALRQLLSPTPGIALQRNKDNLGLTSNFCSSLGLSQAGEKSSPKLGHEPQEAEGQMGGGIEEIKRKQEQACRAGERPKQEGEGWFRSAVWKCCCEAGGMRAPSRKRLQIVKKSAHCVHGVVWPSRARLGRK